jgi:maltose alpha-D-glucosyltransferase/alpha-amylase
VRSEIRKIMGFWLQLGVSGFRMDAVPFLIEKKGAGVEPQQDFNILKEMREFLQWRSSDAIMLAEANVPPEESMNYFGDEGDRLQMMLNFAVNQRLFYALATADTQPLVWALEQTAKRPPNAQWVNFLRSHDELDLGRLTVEQRQRVFDAFAPRKTMQLYNRGIRRRLAPMLDNDRRRLELAFSLLFTLPGTPMQWTNERHGGFSRAAHVVRPVINDAEFGFTKVNVADQRRDPQSLLNWTERVIRMRRECPEISWGSFSVLRTNVSEVLALRYDWRGTSLVTLHNFSNRQQKVKLKVGAERDGVLVEVFADRHSQAHADGMHRVTLDGYAWRWYRVGAADNALDRTDLQRATPETPTARAPGR